MSNSILTTTGKLSRKPLSSKQEKKDLVQHNLNRSRSKSVSAEKEIDRRIVRPGDQKIGRPIPSSENPVKVDKLEDEAAKRGITKNELLEQIKAVKQKQVEEEKLASERRKHENYVSGQGSTETALETERDRQYEEYKERVGEIISGKVKKIRQGNIIVDLGNAEGYIWRKNSLSLENLQPGDSVLAYLYNVSREQKGPQIFLSRIAPEFMVKLFAQYVPEVANNVIEIKACVRDPGSRAKIAVVSHDDSIDAVGSCVGKRGVRASAVSREFCNEKIEIVPWSDDPATFVEYALRPAKVTEVVFDEENEKFEVFVAEDQIPLAIGKRGQNVRLASQLTGRTIDLSSNSEYSKRKGGYSSEKGSN